MEDIIESFGERLDRLIKEKELSYRELGKRCDISHSTIASWAGKDSATPTDHQALKRISKELEVSFEYLLLGEVEEDEYEIGDHYVESSDPIYSGFAKVVIYPMIKRKK